MNREEQKLAMQIIELGCNFKAEQAENARLRSEVEFLRGLVKLQAEPARFVDRMRSKR